MTYVVDDMEVGNIVQEEASLPAEERPIAGRSCAALEVPFLAAVMRHDRVGVVEVSDHNDWKNKEDVNQYDNQGFNPFTEHP